MDYRNDIHGVLTAIGRTDRPQTSGAAVALTLSIGIECLALHLSLSTRVARPEHDAYFESLRDHIEAWRESTQRAFVEDPAHVADLIDARRRGEEGEEATRLKTAQQEVEALRQANGVLVRLMDVSLSLEDHAAEMLRERGIAHARAEAATAMFLAEAATKSITAMLVANVRSASARRASSATAALDVNAIESIARRIPHEDARLRLTQALSTLDGAT